MSLRWDGTPKNSSFTEPRVCSSESVPYEEVGDARLYNTRVGALDLSRALRLSWNDADLFDHFRFFFNLAQSYTQRFIGQTLPTRKSTGAMGSPVLITDLEIQRELDTRQQKFEASCPDFDNPDELFALVKQCIVDQVRARAKIPVYDDGCCYFVLNLPYELSRHSIKSIDSLSPLQQSNLTEAPLLDAADPTTKIKLLYSDDFTSSRSISVKLDLRGNGPLLRSAWPGFYSPPFPTNEIEENSNQLRYAKSYWLSHANVVDLKLEDILNFRRLAYVEPNTTLSFLGHGTYRAQPFYEDFIGTRAPNMMINTFARSASGAPRAVNRSDTVAYTMMMAAPQKRVITLELNTNDRLQVRHLHDKAALLARKFEKNVEENYLRFIAGHLVDIAEAKSIGIGLKEDPPAH